MNVGVSICPLCVKIFPRRTKFISFIILKENFSERFNQFKFYLDLDEPVGRRLNFLIQEIGREINTIGSKSPMTEVTNCVIEIKDELEKIREQIQNIL